MNTRLTTKAFLRLALVCVMVVGLVAVIFPLSASAAGSNVLTNADMESGTTNWVVNGSGTLSSDTTQHHGGTHSVKITGRTANWNGIGQNVAVSNFPTSGHNWTVSVWVRSGANAPTGIATLRLTASTTTYVQLASAAINSTGWTLVTGTVPVSWSGTLTGVLFYVETAAGTDDLYIDDASLLDASAGGPTNTPTITSTPGSGNGTPYGGTAANVPGTVQAENYNVGGEGVAYHDNDTSNQGGQYRTSEGVDVETTADSGGGYDIGYTNTGEWMKYTVNVTAAGTYNLDFRIASPNTGSTFHLEVDGTNVTGTMTVPNTGGWQTWQTITKTGVSLSAGSHVLRLFEDAGGMNFNWLSVSIPGQATATPTPTATPGSNPSTYSNPVLWEDLADIDIIRVGSTYYYSASTMHYSPGAPILRSYDLVNWEFIGHSVPVLDWGSAYDLNGGRAYVKGIWASTIGYRASNSTFYWYGCTEFNRTYVYTATSVTGPWQKRTQLNTCYYDAGLLIDTNDTMYVAYGNTNISVAQLSADGLSQVSSQQVFTTPANVGTLEGSRFYKINGNYYIFLTRPANGQYVLKASSPWGPYTMKQLLLDLPGPISGGGVPHQGGLVQTQNGDWYYMAFVDSFPGGRVPVLAPITWGADGFPVLTTVSGKWGASYPFPNLPYTAVKSPTGTDSFSGTALGPEWEWNHNPDTTKFSVNNLLTLQAATVTNDLYQARNTLTHRIIGPTSTATIKLNYGNMHDGDRAGFALLRDLSAWIGVRRDSGAYRVAFVNNINMDSNWNTSNTGTEVTSAAVSGGTIWLRIAADINPGTGKQGKFYYSTDGTNFTQLGTYTLGNAWQFFMGYRYAIFNYATQALGGSVTVNSFTMTKP